MTAAAPSPPPEPVALGPAESLFWRYADAHGSVGRALAVVLLDGDVERGVLRAAVDRLQQRHPKLRAVVDVMASGRRGYRFDMTVPPIPCTVTTHAGELPWRDTARRLMAEPFSAGGPFAAVAADRRADGRRSALLITLHHGLADGLSALMLLGDLLAAYADVDAGVAAAPPLAPVTALRARPAAGWRTRLALLRGMWSQQRARSGGEETPLPAADRVPALSQWALWTLSPAETLRVVRACRRERASLGSVLIAATLCGVMEALAAPAGRFTCHFPFDLRDEVSASGGRVGAEDLGCFVTIMRHIVPLAAAPSFWDLARHVHGEVEAFVAAGGPAFTYNLTSLLTHPRVLRAIPRREEQRITLLATSYGVVGLRDAYGGLRPTACTLAFNHHGVGPRLIAEGLVLGQRLNVGFAGDGLDPAFWEALQAAVRRRLDEAAGQA